MDGVGELHLVDCEVEWVVMGDKYRCRVMRRTN